VASNLPLLLIEGVLVFGGALAFGWWQLRSLERDRQALLRQRADEAARQAAADAAEADASSPGQKVNSD
jgi:hypothetical protein